MAFMEEQIILWQIIAWQVQAWMDVIITSLPLCRHRFCFYCQWNCNCKKFRSTLSNDDSHFERTWIWLQKNHSQIFRWEQENLHNPEHLSRNKRTWLSGGWAAGNCLHWRECRACCWTDLPSTEPGTSNKAMRLWLQKLPERNWCVWSGLRLRAFCRVFAMKQKKQKCNKKLMNSRATKEWKIKKIFTSIHPLIIITTACGRREKSQYPSQSSAGRDSHVVSPHHGVCRCQHVNWIINSYL